MPKGPDLLALSVRFVAFGVWSFTAAMGRCFGLACAPVPEWPFLLDSRAALLSFAPSRAQSLRYVGHNVGVICAVIL